MKTVRISDEAWEYVLQVKTKLKNTKSMGELISEAILNGVKP
jgi:predicted CopG family antitoxin